MNSRRRMLPDPVNSPKNIEGVFADFKGRRTGLIKAFTTEFQNFFLQCDPEKENLCLYGFSDETWEVNEPYEGLPPEAPEPVLGINFARDELKTQEWLAEVAMHTDVWLLAISHYLGARAGFIKPERMQLFNMISDLPSLFEVVTGAAAMSKLKGKSSVPNHRGTKSRSRSRPKLRATTSKLQPKDEVGGEEGQGGESICGACGEEYVADEFWICCDVCEKWYHGKCVRITPAAAEYIKIYTCPTCCRRRRGGLHIR